MSYRIIENPALEVAPDLSASHRIEEDPEVTLRHLRHAFVERVAISAVPSQTFVRALQDREHTFSVQTLVIGNADLHSMESEELRALIRSIPKLNQLSRLLWGATILASGSPTALGIIPYCDIFLLTTCLAICDSQLKQDHFSDLLLHECATRGGTSIVSHQMMDTSPMLTGTGLREFYSVGVRGGQNEPCFMDLRCRGDYTEHFLLEFLEVSSTITMTLNAGVAAKSPNLCGLHAL